MLRRRSMMAAASSGGEPTPDIPSAYQKVEYLESSPTTNANGPMIDSGVSFSSPNNAEFEIDYQPMQKSNGTAYQAAIGTRQTNTGGTNNMGFFVGTDATRSAHWAWSGYGPKITPESMYKRVTIKGTWAASSITISDGETTVSESGSSRGCSGYHIYLFAVKRASTYTYTNTFGGRIYRAKIRQDGDLLSDLIPCYEIDTGTIGMYDVVNERFCAVSGATDKIAVGSNA